MLCGSQMVNCVMVVSVPSISLVNHSVVVIFPEVLSVDPVISLVNH